MSKQQEYLSAIDSLKRWLRKNRLSHSVFAQSIGISKYALSWILHDRKVGRRFFTLDQAVVIEKMTNCEISANVLLFPVLPSGYLLAKASDSVAGCGTIAGCEEGAAAGDHLIGECQGFKVSKGPSL